MLKKFVKENIPESQENNIYIGFSTMMSNWNEKLRENFIKGVDRKSLKYFFNGIGRGIGKRFGFNERKCYQEIEKVKGAEKEYLYEGFTKALMEAKF